MHARIAPDSQLLTSPEYAKHLKDFNKRKPLKSVKVLDLFSGIGAGIIILKRLKIPIETVVHVEHDPVANFVNWYNHENRQDGINHIYIEDYDDINGNKEIRALIDKHGPFDIIFAGPPCCDFCKFYNALKIWYIILKRRPPTYENINGVLQLGSMHIVRALMENQ